MLVNRITTQADLERLRLDWNRLSGGVIFRRWEWLANWWFCHEPGRQLYVLTASNEAGQIVGIAPWYVELQPGEGRVIRVLGSIRASADYVGLLAEPQDQTAVSQAFCDWLLQNGSQGASEHGWDLMELKGIQVSDPGMTCFSSQMMEGKHRVHCRDGESCWQIVLSATWDEYLTRLSKSVRRRVRVLEKQLRQIDKYQVRLARTREEISAIWPTFVDLHQRRRASLGQVGCFSTAAFSKFLFQAVTDLSQTNEVELISVIRDGRPIAMELNLISHAAYQVFQVGIDPDSLDDSPGWLVNVAALHRARELGLPIFDLLRGDEQYKSQLRADPHPTIDLRIVPNRLGPQMRHGVWLASNVMKKLIKSGMNKTGVW